MGINLNGRSYDHSSIRVRIDGITESRCEEISWSHGIEGIAKLFGTARQAQSRTAGQYKVDSASITLSKQAWIELRSRFGAGFLEHVFDIEIESQDIGAPFVKDTLKSCQITKIELSSSQGGAAQVAKLTLDVMYALENGTAPILNFER